MAVTYAAGVKTARMQAVADKIDAAATAGKLKLGTTGMGTVIATITLTDPCGTVSGSTLTLDLDPDIEVAASAAGDLAAAVITDGDDNTVISGLTVGTSVTDIVVDSVTVASGQLVRVTTGTITHA